MRVGARGGKVGSKLTSFWQCLYFIFKESYINLNFLINRKKIDIRSAGPKQVEGGLAFATLTFWHWLTNTFGSTIWSKLPIFRTNFGDTLHHPSEHWSKMLQNSVSRFNGVPITIGFILINKRPNSIAVAKFIVQLFNRAKLKRKQE